ncbi:right-handed parallel beta-helix repeat-containing protein [Streptomyces sp. KL116D]|uniref:right-handed parallel beta-helix repeat-containing protein n=1 Tax=Streptomyces sp. KL116D TaxID=3045152 RepID=UPI00355608C6
MDGGACSSSTQGPQAPPSPPRSVANVAENALYSRGVADLEVSGSTFSDNKALGSLSAGDAAFGVSHDIDVHDNTMSGNRAGLRLYTGTSTVTFTKNTVSGQPSTVVAAPAHGVTVASNTVTQSEPAESQAAVMAAPLYEDAATSGSYSSSDIDVRDNTFKGTGTWIRSAPGRERTRRRPPDPAGPAARRRQHLPGGLDRRTELRERGGRRRHRSHGEPGPPARGGHPRRRRRARL